MYVPEVHPITGMEFHEREDDAHVLKVCGSKLIGMSYNLLLILFPVENCKFNAPRQQQRAKTGAFLWSVRRSGVITDIPCPNWTAKAVGERRWTTHQRGNGGLHEKAWVYLWSGLHRGVFNWRPSSHERGLTQLQRTRYNYQTLMYLLDDLMPWHRDHDYSVLEVNRYVHVHIRRSSCFNWCQIVMLEVEIIHHSTALLSCFCTAH